jgi:hypothetical protein
MNLALNLTPTNTDYPVIKTKFSCTAVKAKLSLDQLGSFCLGKSSSKQGLIGYHSVAYQYSYFSLKI